MSVQSDEHLGSRWGVYETHVGPWEPDEDGWVALGARTPDHYVVRDMFDGDSNKEFRFKSEAAAERKADELNRFDVQGPLDPAFAARRKRLKRLAPHFGGWSFDGPNAARWPVRPKRYAVEMGYDGEDWWELADDATELEAIVSDGTHHIIDLDTGAEVPFEVSVSVNLEAVIE